MSNRYLLSILPLLFALSPLAQAAEPTQEDLAEFQIQVLSLIHI